MLDIATTKKSFKEAVKYLKRQGLVFPKFKVVYSKSPFESHVIRQGTQVLEMKIGAKPTKHWTDWSVMHELGHVLVTHKMLHNKRDYKSLFGAPQPDNYNNTQWWGVLPTFVRPRNYPSWYGKKGGGEERFAELLAYMYTMHHKFDNVPPPDLQHSWNVVRRLLQLD